MNVFVYQAALWCEECGAKIRADLTAAGKAPEDPEDDGSYDSDDFPKGPYPDGGGEADHAQHCDGCGVHLENPLTAEGERNVCEAVLEAALLPEAERNQRTSWVEWRPFYDVDVMTIARIGNSDVEATHDHA